MTINGLRNDDVDAKRIQHTEIDREYAILVARTRSRECNVTGEENGDLKVECVKAEDDAVRVPERPIKREFCDAELANEIERWKRDYREVKRLKKMVVELENAMKETAKKYMISLEDITEDCSAEEEQDTDGDDVEALLSHVAGTEQSTDGA